MSRRKRKTREPNTSGDIPAEYRLEGFLKIALVVLLLSRFFVPAENAADGETLLWVLITFAIFTLWAWDGMKSGLVRFTLTRFDFAFLLIVLAHLISGLAVIFTEGQKRAALNMVWEWLGLGVTLFLLRQFVSDSRFYKQFLIAIVSVVVALSCLGIYQHFVWYPQQGAEYQTLRKELDKLESSGNPRHQSRMRKIQTDLAAQGIPLNGPERKRFEDRLISSKEPFVMFALANTFAGLLAVGLLMVLGTLVSANWKVKSLKDRIPLLIALLVIGSCLLLTKSRTACVGTICGAGFIVWMTFRTKLFSKKFSKLVETCVILVVGIGLLVLPAMLISGLNIITRNEALHSLSFRFQYWQGTLGVIGESPMLGTGPGNFRQHYLKHKLAESSEEILDPHNFFFDLWANAGILAALGIAVAIFFVILSVRKSFPEDDPVREEPLKKSSENSQFPGILIGLILSLLVFLFRSNFDIGINLFVCVTAIVMYTMISRIPEIFILRPAVLPGCCIAMMVHLLGAGGIEMPMVVIVLLILSVAITANAREENDFRFGIHTTKQLAMGPIIGLILTLACLFTGFYPSFQASSLTSLASSNSLQGQIEAAEENLRKATEADPLSPKPWVDLSNLIHSKSLASSSQDKDFQEAVKLQEQAIARNPHSWQGYRMLGKWFAERYRRSQKLEPLESAIENFNKSVARYPTNSQLRADFAFLLNDAKRFEEAQEQAREALFLHAINREAGHLDKFLPEDQLEKLTEIVEQ